MKFTYLLLISIAAFVTAAAFRAVTNDAPTQTVGEFIAEKKKFTIRCAPLYVPVAGEDIPVLSGWGNYSWKITTASDSAQLFFNQGLNMYYAFHIIEARASFERATKFDPDCAMAWWGKALAFGPNINDFGYQRPSEAFPSATRANELKAPATVVEKLLIEAMANRYTADTAADQHQLNMMYRDKMKMIFTKFNDDENVSTLYADALMLLHPWDLYDHNFKPKQWTPEIVSVLKHAHTLNAKHPDANHYLIHAVEASSKPEQALKSANFLATAMPDVSHITHMPSHIYIRSGNYAQGIVVNDNAVAGYKKYLQSFPATEESSMLYDLHNVHMRMNCALMAGNYEVAIKSAVDLQQKIPGFYLSMPGALGNYIQYVHQSTLFTWIRFGKWDDILKEQVIDSLNFTPVLQHFARGMAFTRKQDLTAALVELAMMKTKMEEPSLKEPFAPMNSTYDPALVALNILQGVIAELQQNKKAAINAFKTAVIAEDNLIYNEPRDWPLPARHYLGNAMINTGQYLEAIKVFNKDLQINPNNGWALTGLEKCYQQLKDINALKAVQKNLASAWVIKDTRITAAVF